MWTTQYYALQNMYHQPRPSTFLTNNTLPSTIPVYAIGTRNGNPTNHASNEYYLKRKTELAEGIAGEKGKVKDWVWCEGDCDQSFPVSRAKWTADMLVKLGI